MDTKQITRIGIFSAISLVMLLLANYIRTTTLSFLVLSSFITGIAYLYTNTKAAILHYVSVSILAIILLPDKSIAITYILLFGIYGIVKLFIEQINNRYVVTILKNIFAIASYYIIYKIAGEAIMNIDNITEKYNLPILLFYVVLIVLFNLYDYLFTAAMMYINKKILKKR